MNENLVLLTFFSQIIMALFLATLRRGNLLCFRLLAAFLALGALDLSNFIFEAFYANHLALDMTRANMALLYGPLLFFFTQSVLFSNFRLSPNHLWHVMPFIIMTLVFLPNFYLADGELRQAFYHNLHQQAEIIAINAVNNIQLACYLVISYKAYLQQQQTIRENYSEQSKLQNHWLRYFLLLFSAHFAFVLIRNVAKFIDPQMTITILTPLMLISTLLFYTWLLFQAMVKPQLFNGINSELRINKRLPQSRSSAEIEQHSQLEQRLRTHLQSKKPYLEPSLTLVQLSNQLNIDKDTLSQVINHHIGSHFFDLINHYRVKEAAAMLANPEHADKTILEIMYTVGFNSKSSFNSAFKQKMQQTPSAFRRKQKN